MKLHLDEDCSGKVRPLIPLCQTIRGKRLLITALRGKIRSKPLAFFLPAPLRRLRLQGEGLVTCVCLGSRLGRSPLRRKESEPAHRRLAACLGTIWKRVAICKLARSENRSAEEWLTVWDESDKQRGRLQTSGRRVQLFSGCLLAFSCCFPAKDDPKQYNASHRGVWLKTIPLGQTAGFSPFSLYKGAILGTSFLSHSHMAPSEQNNTLPKLAPTTFVSACGNPS